MFLIFNQLNFVELTLTRSYNRAIALKIKKLSVFET